MTISPRDDSKALPQRRFASKRDLWIVVVLWGAALALVFASFRVVESPTPLVFKALFLLLCIPSAVLLPWVLYGTSYLLTDEALSIRCGPFRHRVPVGAIQEVIPSRNPASSPACSLDRLHVGYRGSRSGILISPRDKRAFLQDLALRDSRLTLRGDRIVRRA